MFRNVEICIWKDFKLFFDFFLSMSYVLDNLESIDVHIEEKIPFFTVFANKNMSFFVGAFPNEFDESEDKMKNVPCKRKSLWFKETKTKLK